MKTASEKMLSPPKSPSIGITRPFKILLITAFANGLSLGFIIPVNALFFQDKFGMEPLEIGSIISIAGLVGVTASWIGGRASDRFGRKPLIALGGFSTRVGGLILPLTANPSQATIVLSVRSLAFNLYMPSMRAQLADLTPQESRGRLFGLYNSFFTAGDIVGPVISTYLYDMFRLQSWSIGGMAVPGYGMPFYVNSIIGIATIAILIAFVKETVKTRP
jgi:DHA1 family multidrug resistance protein-like MFS transporter